MHPGIMQDDTIGCPTGPPAAPQDGCWFPTGLESHIPALSRTDPAYHLLLLF